MKKFLLLLIFTFSININSQIPEGITMDSLVITTTDDKKLVSYTDLKNFKLTEKLDSIRSKTGLDIYIVNLFFKKEGVKFIESRYFYNSKRYTKDYIRKLKESKIKKSHKHSRI